ncbi:hypothetical protein [Luteolibacter sp. AS25]|uniref:hypothetical protein n=1 Tax=Luteolibacter sp. AS25 TaxID=3135776 RepID=UPI00398A9EED
MSEQNSEEKIDKSDLDRAENGSPNKVPLKANEEDAYVEGSELQSSEPTEEEKQANDPTSDRSSTT